MLCFRRKNLPLSRSCWQAQSASGPSWVGRLPSLSVVTKHIATYSDTELKRMYNWILIHGAIRAYSKPPSGLRLVIGHEIKRDQRHIESMSDDAVYDFRTNGTNEKPAQKQQKNNHSVPLHTGDWNAVHISVLTTIRHSWTLPVLECIIIWGYSRY